MLNTHHQGGKEDVLPCPQGSPSSTPPAVSSARQGMGDLNLGTLFLPLWDNMSDKYLALHTQ